MKTNTNLPSGMRARKRERKNGKTVIYYFYEAKTEDGKRKEISLGTDYHRAILEYAQREINSQIKANSVITFSIMASRYKTDIIDQSAPNTQKNYKYAQKQLTNFFGNPDAPIEQITPTHIRQYLDHRRQCKTASRMEVAFFSAMFNHAREIGYTNTPNPVLGIKKPSKNNRTVYIEHELYELVYNEASQAIRDLMDVAYLIGQRPVDIVNIHAQDIKDGILHISQKKTGNQLRFKISGSLKEILDRITKMATYLKINLARE